MATNVTRPSGVPSTAEMLEMLDQVTQDIPKMLESLGNAIGTLVDRNTDAAKVDVWERNLKGFSGQYYGRLATCQNSLRTVIRHLHTLQVDPHTIRPPTTSLPPPAFSPPGPDKPYAPEAGLNQPEAVSKAATIQDPASQAGLSLYAARLELKALQDMQKALHGLMEEGAETMEMVPTSPLGTPSRIDNMTQSMEESPTTSAATPGPEPAAVSSPAIPSTVQPTSQVISPKANGAVNGGSTLGGGGLGGLVGYADSDGSDVEMDG